MDLIETQLEQPIKHWYYRHKYWGIRNEIVKRHIVPTEILDVGAGSAIFSLELQKEFPGTFVLAVDPGYSIEQIGKSNTSIKYSRTSDVNGANLILLTDVLEHVPDDFDFLSRYVGIAKPGSVFIITVPAFMSLWSNHDVYLKHYRRYRKDDLIQVIDGSGLDLLEVKYLYSLLFPIAFLKRRFAKRGTVNSDLKQEPGFVQKILNTLLFFDRFLSKFMPFGVSILAVGIKRAPNAGKD